MQKDILLFDLGGVIVPWIGTDFLAEKYDMSRDAVTAKLAASNIFNDYETGDCDDLTFLTEMVTLFNMGMTPEAFSSLWNSWVLEPFPNTLDVLRELKEKYVVACLSNTNALHWTHLGQMFEIEQVFDFAFASQHMRVAKPHPRSFQIPLEEMGVEVSRVTYFDDTVLNVEAARREGLTTHHVDRQVGVIPTLQKLGLI